MFHDLYIVVLAHRYFIKSVNISKAQLRRADDELLEVFFKLLFQVFNSKNFHIKGNMMRVYRISMQIFMT